MEKDDMGYTINTTAAKTLLTAIKLVLLAMLIVLGSTWFAKQPIYIMGQSFGYNAQAFEDLQSQLASHKKQCTAQLENATQKINDQQQALEQYRTHHDKEQQQVQATWFPIADVLFSKAERNKVWRHPDSELNLALESITGYPDELVLSTNLPAPANKLRLTKKEQAWNIPMKTWNYRVLLLSLDTYEGVATIRIERQIKY